MKDLIIPILLFILGLVALIKGGDWFVDGACGIAKRFRVPELLIGATVVSIGTTLPEVMVSATSAVTGHGEMAYGNAIGSIICNSALIAAITITVKPGEADRKSLVIPLIFFFGAAIFYSIVAYFFNEFSRITGIILLLAFIAYIAISVFQAKKSAALEPKVAQKDENNSKGLIKEIALLIVGAALIAVGARLLVDNGTKIAQFLGVPETVIAITFVALGTSLPELVTAITSLIKGHGALSLGNLIGANLFNLVLVSGISIVLSPFAVPVQEFMGLNRSLVIDIPVMFAVMGILTIPALIRGKLSRWQGVLLLIIYAGFCVIQFAF
ncbi:MAG: calcium/sodium antiporter [Clostridia bacterium]|nr:calcium/sodium antiporter [Clostridia bacterium]